MKCKYGALICNTFVSKKYDVILIFDFNLEFQVILPFDETDLHPFTLANFKLRNCRQISSSYNNIFLHTYNTKLN